MTRWRGGMALCLAMTLGLSAQAATVSVAGTPYSMTEKDCNAVVAHQPRPDVAYQPGVDGHGRAVMPADIDGTSRALAATLPGATGPVDFTVKASPFKAAAPGTAAATLSAQTALPVARVSYDPRTGRLLVNGVALSDPATAIIAESCRQDSRH